jgi:hypothetical protein
LGDSLWQHAPQLKCINGIIVILRTW